MSDCPSITLSLPVAPAITIVNPDVLGLAFSLQPVVQGGGSTSGSYDPLGTAATTGQMLYGDLTGLSGAAASTYATLPNLTLTGVTIEAQLSSLSGWAASSLNLINTGAALYADMTGLSGLVAFLGALQTFTGVNIFLNSGLGNNLTAPGIVLYNPTTASTTNQQYSPAVVWSGQGWKTSAGGASRAIAFRAYAAPVQGGSAPTATWNLDYQLTGGTGWTNVFSISSVGSFTSAGSITANGGFVSASPTLGFYATSALSQVLGATVDASDGFGFYLAFPNQNGQYTQTNTLTLSNNNQNNTLQINGTTVLNQDVSSTGSPAFNGVVLSGNQIGANSSGIVFNGVAIPTGVALAKPIGFSTDGAGNVVVSGIKGYVTSPYAGTFTSWSLAAMQQGNLTVDIWKIAAGTVAPTTSIIGAGGVFPSLSNAQFAYSPHPLNWATTTVATGDIIAWVVSGAPTSITKFTFELTIT